MGGFNWEFWKEFLGFFLGIILDNFIFGGTWFLVIWSILIWSQLYWLAPIKYRNAKTKWRYPFGILIIIHHGKRSSNSAGRKIAIENGHLLRRKTLQGSIAYTVIFKPQVGQERKNEPIRIIRLRRGQVIRTRLTGPKQRDREAIPGQCQICDHLRLGAACCAEAGPWGSR